MKRRQEHESAQGYTVFDTFSSPPSIAQIKRISALGFAFCELCSGTGPYLSEVRSLQIKELVLL